MERSRCRRKRRRRKRKRARRTGKSERGVVVGGGGIGSEWEKKSRSSISAGLEARKVGDCASEKRGRFCPVYAFAAFFKKKK